MLSDFLPRGVPLQLGPEGVTYYALPLRVRDLADLEQIGRAMLPDVLSTLPPQDVDTPEHRRTLKEALDIAEKGQPGWNDAELRAAVLQCDAGLLTLLRAALRSHDIAHANVPKLAMGLTPDQWAAVMRVAFGGDAASEILRRIDLLIGCPLVGGAGIPWVEAVCDLCREFGYTPEQAGELTLTQVSLLRSGGKRPDVWYWDGENASAEDDAAFHAVIQPRREAFFKAFESTGGDEEPPLDRPDVIEGTPAENADLDVAVSVSRRARGGRVRKD
jgi:hypothetical protein